jgi:predicted phosphodiesterase
LKKQAILSDIHGNWHALQEVLKDIDAQGVDEIICLGDTVGYGPRPRECLETALQRFSLHLLGNHEWAVLNGPLYFNPVAKKAIEWTIEELHGLPCVAQLKKLKPAHPKLDEGILYVHGSIRDPLMDYVRDLAEEGHEGYLRLLATIRNDFQKFNLCFVGHNHKAFLGTEHGDLFPHDDVNSFHIQGQKLYVCVGSVGQPRDGYNTSCYVIFDGKKISYRRVPYDVDKTADEIRAAGLPEYLAERLLKGV